MKRLKWKGARRALVCVLAGWAACASGATYHVAQGHPGASDGNAGTSEAAPLKSIQAALDKAVAGDTVRVKKGVYRETALIRNGGVCRGSPLGGGAFRWSSWVVLTADGDDEVIIDGSDPVRADAWKPVPGKPGVYVARVETPPGPANVRPPRGVTSVYWNGRRLSPCLQRRGASWARVAPGPGDVRSWHYDAPGAELHVNLGGADPRDRRQGVVEAAVRAFGVVGGQGRDCVMVRKLTVRRAAWRGISLSTGMLPVVEDCHVRDCEHGIAAGGTLFPIVRRCVAHDVCARAMDVGGNVSGRFYDNVVYAFGQDWFRETDTFSPWAFILFGAEFGRYFHNVVVQPYAHRNADYRGGGFWPDCHSPSHWFAGNAVYQAGTGFYIESPAMGNVARWNTACRGDAGIILSVNALNQVAENYVADNTVGCGLQGTESPEVRHNLFSQNWLKNNGIGLRMGPEAGVNAQTRNYAQRNVYEGRAGGRLARWVAADFTNLTAFTQATGQESLGAATRILPDELGVAWVSVGDMDASHEVIPMFGNPGVNRQGCQFDADPFFWTRGVESGKDTYPGWWSCVTDHKSTGDVYPGVMAGLRPWCEQSPGAVSAWLDGPALTNTLVGGKYLAAGALPGHGFGTNGVGWWSPSLPVAGGADVDVGLWMKLENVRPLPGKGCGAVVYVEWSNWTGQQIRRSYLVGGGIGARPLRPELATGTRGWTEIKATVTAPAEARRMALFLGGRACTGKIGFDEIRTLAVRPGRPPRQEPGADGVDEGLSPTPRAPLVEPATLNFFELDLGNVVNRRLRDGVLGGAAAAQARGAPAWDLRHLGVGRRFYGRVPFTILEPLSCVALDPHYRPEGRLPKHVEIPVNRKADVLYFLHASAWMAPRSDGLASAVYFIQYGDGYEKVYVRPGVNIRDWAAQGALALAGGPGMQATVPVELKEARPVPVEGVACLEWVNPRKDKPIKQITFASADGVPILLGITGGVTR